MARQIHKEFGVKRLCMAGGVALNSVANGRIVRETPIEELYIQPSAGDGGGAVGAALYAYHTVLGKPRQFVMEHAYWGQEHDAGDTEAFLKQNGIPYERLDKEEKLIERVVDNLQGGKVIGWSQGKVRMGTASIGESQHSGGSAPSGDERYRECKIKFREPFRPFAPSVLSEKAEDYFVLADPPKTLSRSFHALCRGRERRQTRRLFPRSRMWTARAGFKRCGRNSIRNITG